MNKKQHETISLGDVRKIATEKCKEKGVAISPAWMALLIFAVGLFNSSGEWPDVKTMASHYPEKTKEVTSSRHGDLFAEIWKDIGQEIKSHLAQK